MAGWVGYVVGAVQIIAGILLIATPAGIPLIISGATTIAGTALAPRPTGSSGGFRQSSTYGFDAISNSAFEGSPRAFVLGQHRLAPSYISAYTEQSGKVQTLKALLFCGTGGSYGIEEIADIRLNDQPVGHYSDVTTTTRLGTSDQTAIKGFEKVSTPYEDGTQFEDGEVWTYTTHEDVDEVGIVLAWYQGLYGIKQSGDSKGKIEQTGWQVKVEYQDEGSSTWTVMGADETKGDGWRKAGSGIWKVEGKTQSVKRMVMNLKWTTTATRTIRLTAQNGNTSSDKRDPTLLRVEERVDDARTYAGSAILAIEAVASGMLAGGLPRITAVVKGWKVQNLGDTSPAWTRNPAKLIYAFATDATDGAGKVISSSDLDDGVGGTWRTAVTHFDSNAATTGDHAEARYQLDLVVDTMQPASDWLQHMLTTCRSQIIEWGGELRLLTDKAGSSVATFDGRQTRSTANRPILMLDDGRADITIKEIESDNRATHVKAQYWDREDDYERRWTDEFTDPDYTSGDPSVYRELYLPGVTRQTQAVRAGRYAINDARLRTKLYEIGVGIGDLNLLPFDVITVYADSPPLSGTELQVVGTAYGADHTARIVARTYDADVYDDTSDTPQAKALSLSRSDALKKATAIPAGVTNLKLRVVNT